MITHPGTIPSSRLVMVVPPSTRIVGTRAAWKAKVDADIRGVSAGIGEQAVPDYLQPILASYPPARVTPR